MKETDNHVLYRVTPIFTGDNLVADGVLMEGYSVEDEGDGICFCVYAYNVQPGITIDYATGDSWLSSEKEIPTAVPAAILQSASQPQTKAVHSRLRFRQNPSRRQAHQSAQGQSTY